jgi:hypothetical protein
MPVRDTEVQSEPQKAVEPPKTPKVEKPIAEPSPAVPSGIPKDDIPF